MAKVLLYALVLTLFVNVWLVAPIQAHEHERKAYIVYMGDLAGHDIPFEDVFLNIMRTVLTSDFLHFKDVEHHLRYKFNSFKGCVVHLTVKEAELISGMDGVVSVFPSEKRQLRTTRSWDFMGFPLNVKRTSLKSDIIVGVIDTCIWPESESFSDEGFGPHPAKWKGTCDASYDDFACNNKVIGARYFRGDGNFSTVDLKSPRDSKGHGTHTASTAAGAVVEGASFLGLAKGTARGGVPSARIAVYKACWSDGCSDADLLAAFDAAIYDCVDIISISIGSPERPYFVDSIAIGAFHAMMKGIRTSSSAGNDGPDHLTLGNSAPWLLTVAAGSTDRKFSSPISFSNGMVIEGISLNPFDTSHTRFPLIYGGDAANTTSKFLSRFCDKDTLNKTLVKGKIVICDNASTTGESPFLAGAAGVIFQGSGSNSPNAYPLSASSVTAEVGRSVLSQSKRRNSRPNAVIQQSVETTDASAPTVYSLSSRGPSKFAPGILKPDVVAPGVAILAAYSPNATVSKAASDPRKVWYNIQSGTSMACPHASGVAAYIKSFHPTWSPAAIKSALMTTALPITNSSAKEAELAYGSGHISPLKALNPGLVYDANEYDYVQFLCSQGLSATSIHMITGKHTYCSYDNNKGLNYPSMTIPAINLDFDTVFYRTVTNVGKPYSTYCAFVTTPKGEDMTVKVSPTLLKFKYVGEKKTFKVRVSDVIGLETQVLSASLVWDDGVHKVRSPILVYNKLQIEEL